MMKKKQHYVWRHYLSPWAKNDQVFCLSAGKVFLTNLMNVANENYFYKLKELSAKDIDLIKKLLIERTPKLLQDLNTNWIRIFSIMYDFKSLYEKSGRSDPEFERELQKQIVNLEEDLHTRIEQSAIPLLEMIYQEDSSFYDDDDRKAIFNYFIAVQYFRTNKIKKNITGQALGLPQIDLSRIWNVASHIFATNLGMSLYREKELFKGILIRNHTAVPFITGDQPVINTYAKYDEKTILTHEQLELYYPVRPDLALLITRRPDHYQNRILDIGLEEVSSFNRQIKDASDTQIYANQEKILLSMI